MNKTFFILISLFLFVISGCQQPKQQPEKPIIRTYSFTETITYMQQAKTYVENGETKKGIDAFWKAHPFYHTIDPDLRQADPALAEEVWVTVSVIEQELKNEQVTSETLCPYFTHLADITQEAEQKIEKK